MHFAHGCDHPFYLPEARRKLSHIINKDTLLKNESNGYVVFTHGGGHPGLALDARLHVVKNESCHTIWTSGIGYVVVTHGCNHPGLALTPDFC